MATHSLSIAKASLLASCLRPDNTKLNRDDLTTFHNLLETSVASCTPLNIQNSKTWILQHILPSSARTSALAKYLTSLGKNISALPEAASTVRTGRKQLHLLYLLNDIFHHVKYHTSDQDIRKHVREHIPKTLPDLFASAASEKKARMLRRLNDLVNIWESESYCESKVLSSLKDAIETGMLQTSGQNTKDEVKASSKELPWVMPSTHGDPLAPFFDLPAANLMPHIVPNSSKSMRCEDIRALQLNSGPADESLVNALKDFLRDVQSIDNPYAMLEDEGIVPDIDEMGQILYKNEADDVVGDTYYGWSRAFCEKMKTRDQEESGLQRGRSRSVSSGRSSSTSPRKRRRYSSSRSRSRSTTRDKSPARHAQRFRRSSPYTQPSRSFSPQQPPQQPQPQRFGNGYHDYVPPPPPPMSAPFNNTAPSNFRRSSAGPNDMLATPPRPPNWQGPWPPPPPPPPPASGFPGSFNNMPYPPPPQQGFNPHGYGQR